MDVLCKGNWRKRKGGRRRNMEGKEQAEERREGRREGGSKAYLSTQEHKKSLRIYKALRESA